MAGEQLQALQDALLQAFPNEDALRELLLFKMDLKLALITSTSGRSLAAAMLDVIAYVDSYGRLAQLVAGARQLRPQNRELDEVVRRYWPSITSTADAPDAGRPMAVGTGVVAARVRPAETALSENEWQHLIRFIREKKCTPVIGPGVCRGVLADSVELATEWADRWQYPFPDPADLTRVSQFLALTEYRLLPHEQIHQRYSAARDPDFASPDEPHALLADLDLPLYLTTNYDDFMVKALASRRIKAARAFPSWNQTLREQEVAPPDASASALVYHLYGHHEIPESMVLTEDDHFDLLAGVVADPKLLPPAVKRALGGSSLLFIGFGVLDWGFRVLVRTLIASVTAPNKRLGVAVQLPPENLSEAQRAQVERYLQGFLNYSGHVQFRVFWGDTREFARTLRARWESQRGHAAAS